MRDFLSAVGAMIDAFMGGVTGHFVFVGVVAWLTILPSIGVLWLLGLLPS